MIPLNCDSLGNGIGPPLDEDADDPLAEIADDLANSEEPDVEEVADVRIGYDRELGKWQIMGVPDPSHVHEIKNAVVDDEEQLEKPDEIEEVTLEEGGHSDDDDEVVVDPRSLLSVDMEEEEGADSVRDEMVEIAAT